jgi:hypothetical protein
MSCPLLPGERTGLLDRWRLSWWLRWRSGGENGVCGCGFIVDDRAEDHHDVEVMDEAGRVLRACLG